MGNRLSTVSRRSRPTQPAARTAARAGWPGAGGHWSPWWALALVLGYLAQVAFRLWLSRHQVVPLANPDESAYLAEARVLAHAGTPSDFSYGTLYQGGYSLLLVPIYWFTSNSVTVYHATMVVNAVVDALLMPLAYLALRRLSLPRWLAWLGAAVAALVPEGVFYTQVAMSDAIFPVVVLAWLLAVHTWLTARGWRPSLGWGTLPALLAGYSYAVHPRGLVVIAAFGLVTAYAAARRMVPAWSAGPALVMLGLVLAAARKLDHRIRTPALPGGPAEPVRRGSGPADQPARTEKDPLHGVRPAVAGRHRHLGHRRARHPGRGGAGIPPPGVRGRAGHGRAGPGRAGRHRLRRPGRAAGRAAVQLGLGPVSGRPGGDVLHRRPGRAAPGPRPLADRVRGRTLGRWRAVVLLLPILAMNVYALVQMAGRISDQGTQDQRGNSLAVITATGLRPGDKVVLDYDMWAKWESWIPQSFEVWWVRLDMVDGSKGVLPAGTTLLETAWPAGYTAQQTWPQHLPGWHVVATNREYGWVAWRGPAATGR